MKASYSSSENFAPSLRSTRGSVLLVSLLLAAIIGISLVSYLQLSTSSLRASHRTYFSMRASNLVEAGLEEAVWSFNQMGSGVAAATAWGVVGPANQTPTPKVWNLNPATNVATATLPTFSLDQNATGVVKVYVSGYDGTNSAPLVVSQATITPYDGAPIVKITEVTLKYNGYWAKGVVAKNGITWNGHPTANSFISNTNVLTGPYAAYPGTGARNNTSVASLFGSIGLGAGGTVGGNVLTGAGVTVSGNTGGITGTTIPNFTYSFTLPKYPTASSVTSSYNLGSSVPSTLPRTLGDSPASDGRYYYFVSGATIGSTTITSGYNVTIVGSGTTSVSSGLTIQPTGSLILDIDGPVNASGNGAINNSSWAGALQIFTSTTSACTIGGNGTIYCCLFAPYSDLKCNGGGNSGMLCGSFIANTITSNGHMDFHYDETLANLTVGKPWALSIWRELQSASDRALYATQLNF